MKAILFVDTGGFIGSVLRYWFSAWVFRALDKPWFPFGTLAVSVVGCFAIGLLGGIAEQRRFFDYEIRLLIFVGILGGFTTFSAFAHETTILLCDSRLLGAWLNVGLEVPFRLDGSLARQPIVSINLTVFCAPHFHRCSLYSLQLVRSRNIWNIAATWCV